MGVGGLAPLQTKRGITKTTPPPPLPSSSHLGSSKPGAGRVTRGSTITFHQKDKPRTPQTVPIPTQTDLPATATGPQAEPPTAAKDEI